MKKLNVNFWLVFFCFCLPVIKADIIHIPGDHATIQAGINAAVNGDTVLVSDGTYYENINFKGKAITVASHYLLDESEYHINSTIIDGSQPSHPDSGSVVFFVSGEDTNSVLIGFTLTGGKGTKNFYPPNFHERDGGGIFIKNAGAIIEKNKIINNHIVATGNTGALGAGIMVDGNDGDFIIIRDNIISQNSATASAANNSAGATVLLSAKEVCLFENNRVANNLANSNTRAIGCGLLILGDWDYIGPYKIHNNVIIHNKLTAAGGGGGGMMIVNAGPELMNNIIADNTANAPWGGGGILIDQQNDPTTTFRQILVNNTIVNNKTTGNGGGIRVNSPQNILDVKNTILWGNSASLGQQVIRQNGATVEMRYSNIEGGYSGGSNININPLFEDTYTCLLTAASPCIDAGDQSTIYYDPEDSDNPGFALWPARGGLRNDMGAYGGPGSIEAIVGLEVLTPSPENLPDNFQLLQNYPNPFNPSTTIEFSLTKSGWVTLKIYDLLGEEVAELVNENLTANTYKYVWNAENLASGVYFYQLEAAGLVASRKMVLIR